MLETVGLTEIQWETAHAIAQNLVKENADVNELRKAIASPFLPSICYS